MPGEQVEDLNGGHGIQFRMICQVGEEIIIKSDKSEHFFGVEQSHVRIYKQVDWNGLDLIEQSFEVVEVYLSDSLVVRVLNECEDEKFIE